MYKSIKPSHMYLAYSFHFSGKECSHGYYFHSQHCVACKWFITLSESYQLLSGHYATIQGCVKPIYVISTVQNVHLVNMLHVKAMSHLVIAARFLEPF